MIKRFTWGKPIETEAVIRREAVVLMEGLLQVPFFSKVCPGDGKASVFTYDMGEHDRIYGLGENIRGINKRGWLYVSDCVDDPIHTEARHNLYASHNFFLIDGRERFGVFVDAPQKVAFDLGYTDRDRITVTVDEGGFDLYILEGDNLRQMVREFRQVIGRSYIPPKWGFGYGQSRWGYKNEEDIRQVV